MTIYIRWYGLGGEESSSTAIIQALLPDGETVPSRRHNQTDSESGKGVNETDTEEVPVSPSFFGSRDVDFVFLLKMSIFAPDERNGTHYR